MSKPLFQFDLYRLNIVDEDKTLFPDPAMKPIRGDDDIGKILQAATLPDCDDSIETEQNTVKWSLRGYVEYTPEGGKHGDVVGLTLARSLLSEVGPTVTDQGIVNARSETNPPRATPIHLLFNMVRHLIAVEHHAGLASTDGWRKALHRILDKASQQESRSSVLRLEPIPGQDEIISTFRSFTTLTKLRVTLRIPNPEVTRITKRIMDDMENGGVREYLHQMSNPNGISKDENAIPFATVSLAQAGYKQGEVVMEGRVNQVRKRVKTGLRAARATLGGVAKDAVREALPHVRSQAAKEIIGNLLKEMDRMLPADGVQSTDLAKRKRKS